jgi:hypothetical protein
MSEPTVLDYLKAKIQFWKKTDLRFPEQDKSRELEQNTVLVEGVPQIGGDTANGSPFFQSVRIPWQTLVGFLSAIIAQVLLEPPNPSKTAAFAIYIFAFLMLGWSILRKELTTPDSLTHSDTEWPVYKMRLPFLVAAGIFLILAYISFTGYKFTFINITLWLITIFFLVLGFLDFSHFKLIIMGKIASLRSGNWHLNISWWTIFVIVAVGLTIFFRTYQLDTVPPEMTSDHAEKLMDVQDVLEGEWSIFFERNTGREAFQFYWTALISRLFNTGISFMSLKIGMVLAGLLTLPYMFLLAEEFWNRRVALFVLFFAGIAFWPNVISRVGLRFALYPLFTAPALYYLLRGLKYGNRNDFIWAGIAIGLGMHGYSPYRAVPILLLVAVFLFLLHRRQRPVQEKTIIGTIIMGVTAIIVTLPLIRYAIDNYDIFSYRLVTRLSDLERPLPGNPVLIFLENLKKSMLMFGENAGNTWLHSIPDHPALDTVTAALFYLGLVLLIVRYFQHRNWLDLFLVLSIPILMLPSTLSIAFPEENPVLNRTAGAIIPVYLIIAITLDGFLSTIERMIKGKIGRILSFLIASGLIFFSARQNYYFQFDHYLRIYRESAGNTTEMGQVIRGFAESVGTPETAWVVGFPYWCDTRLVSIEAGYPIKDYAIWPDHFEETKYLEGPKLFILNTQDLEDLNTLLGMYPTAKVTTYTSKVPGRDFLVMLVGPEY